MKFSRESRYGLLGLLFLVGQPPGRILSIPEIARGSGLPPSFLAKIFQKLGRRGLVRSFRGTTRGYALARPATEIHVREILDAVEGPDRFERCIFWDEQCGEGHPCPLHDGWKAVKPQFLAFLKKTTLDDLVRGHAATGPDARGGGESARSRVGRCPLEDPAS